MGWSNKTRNPGLQNCASQPRVGSHRRHPGEFLEGLIDRRICDVVGVIRHDLLAIAQDHLKDVALGKACIKEGLHGCVIQISGP